MPLLPASDNPELSDLDSALQRPSSSVLVWAAGAITDNKYSGAQRNRDSMRRPGRVSFRTLHTRKLEPAFQWEKACFSRLELNGNARRSP